MNPFLEFMASKIHQLHKVCSPGRALTGLTYSTCKQMTATPFHYRVAIILVTSLSVTLKMLVINLINKYLYISKDFQVKISYIIIIYFLN